VFALTDINKPEFDQEVTGSGQKIMGCCCCEKPLIDVDIRTSSAAWCPGETIPVLIHVNNRTDKRLDGVSVALERHAVHRAQGNRKITYGQLVSSSNMDGIEPLSDYNTLLTMLVPACCPSFCSRITDHHYLLSLTLHLPSGHMNYRLETGVFIGSIPHIIPPLFAEDKAKVTDSGSQSACTWANPAAVYAAVAAQHPTAGAEETEYEDKYQGSEPAYIYPTEGVCYPYYTLPAPSSYPAPIPVKETSSSEAPLLSSSTKSSDPPPCYYGVVYPVDMPMQISYVSPGSVGDEKPADSDETAEP